MLAWLIETTVASTLLALLAVVIGRSFRLSPAIRHGLWLIVLLRFAMPPLVSWPWATSEHWDCIVLLKQDRPTPTTFEPMRTDQAPPEIAPALPSANRRFDFLAIGRLALVAWAALTFILAAKQVVRIARFRWRFRRLVPVPDWLDADAAKLAGILRVRKPELLILPGPASPMLWCLGRPKLLVPGTLLESLKLEAWRGILIHELAHLKRRDHWTRALAIAISLVWWWNPVYRFARRRLEAEAELACDACAVALLADDDERITYAEALLKICQSIGPRTPPSTALGAVGPGSFLEWRLSMILKPSCPSRMSRWALTGIAIAGLLSVPAWSQPQGNTTDGRLNQDFQADDRVVFERSDFDAVLKILKESEIEAQTRVAKAEDEFEVAQQVVARNQRLNIRKPGSVSGHEVSKAEQELEQALSRLDRAKLDRKRVGNESLMLINAMSLVEKSAASITQKKSRLDVTKAKPSSELKTDQTQSRLQDSQDEKAHRATRINNLKAQLETLSIIQRHLKSELTSLEMRHLDQEAPKP